MFSLQKFGILVALLVVYLIALVSYRLFYHPLSKFPGPKLAAATHWYEFYYDIIKWPGGTFTFEVERMHEIYGPIVRINPQEIHVKDSEWVEVLYTAALSEVRDKYPPAAHMIGTPESIFGTIPSALHRKRRAGIGNFFSKARIASIGSMIWDKTEILCNNLHRQILETGNAELLVNYLATAVDTLSSYALDESLDLLKDDEKAMEWHITTNTIALLTPLVKQYTWILPLGLKIPPGFLQTVWPSLARIVALNNGMHREAQTAIYQHSGRVKEAKMDPKSEGLPQTLFHGILSNNSMPEEEKKCGRIAQEGFLVMAAGGETTARVITVATFHLLANKDTLLKLKEELATVMPEPSSRAELRVLEKLTWLSCVVKESLRIATVITSRLPMVSPDMDLQYKDWVIPAGVGVSMTLRDVLLDPTIFSNPLEFRPQRWLSSNSDLERMNKAWLPFGRGSRMCLGYHLANAEIYIILAGIFRRFDLELYETTRERDIDLSRDCFIGQPTLESKGVRVQLSVPK